MFNKDASYEPTGFFSVKNIPQALLNIDVSQNTGCQSSFPDTFSKYKLQYVICDQVVQNWRN